MKGPDATALDERQLGVDLFNYVWTLLDKHERASAEDDRMIHAAHASLHHWSRAFECGPENLARGEWLCSRVYAVLGRAEPALHHGRRCLELCEENAIGDFDLAYAYEALARARHVAGAERQAADYLERAAAAGEDISDPEDREHFEEDLAELRLRRAASAS